MKNISNYSLYASIASGDIEDVKKNITNGFDTRAVNEFGESPVFFAYLESQISIAEMFVDMGVDINARSAASLLTAAHMAADEGNVENIKSMIKKGARLDILGINNKLPIHYAAKNGKGLVIEEILKSHDCVNSKDVNGRAPIHLAAKHRKDEVAKVLIKFGADVNVEDINGYTPIHYAAESDCVDIGVLLINAGADVNRKNHFGRTALMESITKSQHDFTEFILKNGSNINITDNFGAYPIHHAAEFGDAKCINLLINMGANINSIDNSKKTPLHEAAIAGSEECVQALIENGADVYKTSLNGENALHLGATSNNENIINIFKSKVFDLNIKDDDGQTALHYACSHGATQSALRLIELGANVDAVDNKNRSPLDLVAQIDGTFDDGPKIMAMNLIAHGADAKNHYRGLTMHQAAAQGGLTSRMLSLLKESPSSLPGDDLESLLLICKKSGNSDTAAAIQSFAALQAVEEMIKKPLLSCKDF